MKVVVDNTSNTIDAAAPVQMKGIRLLASHLKWAFYRNVINRLPRLVWSGDEVDVHITFKAHPLGNWSDDLYEIEKRLRSMGVGFDTGSGQGGRDWEWDYSLRGPVSVKFRSRAKNPERRVAQDSPAFSVITSEGA